MCCAVITVDGKKKKKKSKPANEEERERKDRYLCRKESELDEVCKQTPMDEGENVEERSC